MRAVAWSVGRSWALVVVALSALAPAPALAANARLSNVPDRTWQPNGPVDAVLPSADGTKAYLGGSFSYIGPVTGSSVRLDANGSQYGAWPRFTGGAVHDVESDGLGGWIVGGAFTMVDGVSRPNLARVTSTGRLDLAWGGGATPNGSVRTVAVSGSRVYAGGGFTSYGTSTVKNLIAVDTATGALDTAWTSSTGANGFVHDIEVDGGYAYVAGEFTTYAGSTASRIIRIGADSGSHDTAWLSSGANGVVLDLVVDAGVLFMGGKFGAVGGAVRERIAAIDAATGAVRTSFAPGADNAVKSIAVSGSRVYLGGDFSMVAGSSRSFLAAVDRDAGTIDPWAATAAPDGGVRRVHVEAGRVYVGGPFTKISGAVRHGAAQLDAADGSLGAWNPMTSTAAHAFTPAGTTMVVSGAFNSAGGVARTGLAAVDLATGEATAWAPFADGPVHALIQHQGRIFVGGDFNQPRGNLMAVSASGTGTIDPTWSAPAISGLADSVLDLELVGAPLSRVVAGGSFGSVGPAARQNLAAFSLFDGSLDAWAPSTDAAVHALDTDPRGTVLYAAGSFTSSGGVARRHLAAFDPSGALLTWNPGADAPVEDMAVDPVNGLVYVAGAFGTIAGQVRPYLAAITSSGALHTSFSPSLGSALTSVHLNAGHVYAGGKGTPRLMELDLAGANTGWMPLLPEYAWGVEDIASRGSSILAAGSNSLALFHATNDTLAPLAAVETIAEARPGDPGDGIHVSGTRVVARTNGPVTPAFTVRVRAHDRVSSANSSYVGVSGLGELAWPAVPDAQGQWSGDGVQVGKPRGLTTRCFSDTTLDSATSAVGIDRAIAWDGLTPQTRPDMVPNLPASLAAQAGKAADDSGNIDYMSCRWSGYLIGLDDLPGSYVFRGAGDDGLRANVDDLGGLAAPWTTINNWSFVAAWESDPSGPIGFAAGQARPFVLEWYDNSSQAQAQLQWQPPTVTTWAPVPEGAFVTGAYYERTYSFTGGTPTSGSATLNVLATDKAGNSAPGSFVVAVDNQPPAATGSFATTPGAGWSDATAISVAITDGTGDVGQAGLLDRVLKRRIAAIDPATNDCSTAPGPWEMVAGPFTDSTSRTYSEPAPVSTGCYQYRYVSRDNVGNVRIDHPDDSAGGTLWIRVDQADPTGGSISYPSGPSNASAADITFAVPTDAESGIDPGTVQLQRQRAAYSGGACAAAWDAFASIGPASPASPYTDAMLADGSCYRYRLVARDYAGNERIVEDASLVLQVDLAAPTVTIDAKPTGPSGGTVMFSGGASDTGSGATSVDVTFAGPGTGTICANAPITAGSGWTCEWNTTTAADGTYTISVHARDGAGNLGAASRGIVVDNTPPTVSVGVTPTANAEYQHVDAGGTRIWVNGKRRGSFEVSAEVSDPGSGVNNVAFPTLGPGWTMVGSGVATIAPYSETYEWQAGASTPGVVQVTATDNAGSSATAPFEVRVDSTAPTDGSVSYPNGVNSVATITSSPGADADSGIASWRLERREAAAVAPTTCSSSWSAWGMVGPANPPGTFTDSSVRRATCYQYELVVRDRVGHVVRWGSSSVFITDSPGVVITETGTGTAVVEGGATDTYAVRLRAAPDAGTQVVLTLTGDGQATASPSTLTFDASNWTVAQQVTVTAVDDARDEVPETQAATIRHAVSGSDAAYDALPDVLQAVQVTDNDVSSVILSPAAGISVGEGESAGGYQVRLGSQPAGDVTITVSAGSQLSASPSTLTFTATTWATAQPVALAAVDDPDIEGSHAASVTHGVTAPGDALYAGLAAPSLPVTISDNDAAGLDIAVSATAVVDEANPAKSEPVKVRLRARPSADVTITASGVAQQLAAAPQSVTFSPATWNQYQAIAVTAAQDTVAEPSPHAARLELRTASADASFGALQPSYANLAVRDDDPAVLETTPGSGWTLSDAGVLQLQETGQPTATLTIRAKGDPSADIVIAPKLGPDGELEVTPRSGTIPAGSTGHVLTFRFHAVDDRVVEGTPHPARIQWEVRTVDALYGNAGITATSVAITDGAVTTTRETGSGTETSTGTTPTPTAPTNPTQPPGDDRAAETDPQVDGDRATQETAGSAGEDSAGDDRTAEGDDRGSEARREKATTATRNPVKRLGNWAKENKAAASITASAAGTAALWGAKPLLLAGKALGGGGLGGMPSVPDGIGQARRLMKLGKNRQQRSAGRRLLAWGRRRRGGMGLPARPPIGFTPPVDDLFEPLEDPRSHAADLFEPLEDPRGELQDLLDSGEQFDPRGEWRLEDDAA